MRKLFGKCILLEWALALHADDQVRINNAQENPLVPATKFLYSLERPNTLLVAETDLELTEANRWKESLFTAGHDVTTVALSGTPNIRIKSGTRWLYDTIIILSNSLPRTVSNEDLLSADSLLAFMDTPWLMPHSPEENTGGLKLPPSVMVFADDGCSAQTDETIDCERLSKCPKPTMDSNMKRFLAGMGFRPAQQRQIIASECGASREISVSDMASGIINANDVAEMNGHLRYVGGLHQFYPNNELVLPIVSMPSRTQESVPKHSMMSTVNFTDMTSKIINEQEPRAALVSAFQGKRNWSRLVMSSMKSLCAVGTQERPAGTLCQNLLDWVTHRKGVVTWSNLRHWRLHDMKEWSEYEGDVIQASWTQEHLNRVRMTRPYLYRIRDEIVVGVDLWQIVPSVEEGRILYHWSPLQTPLVKFEYNMMETYVRKLLLPANPNVTQSTNLMKAVQRTGFKSIGLMDFNPATHWIHYKAPKQHGIFKLTLKSIGHRDQTAIWIESLMPLRTYKHDEDPRFVIAAFPYYSSMFICTIAFAVVAVILPLLPPVRDEKKE